MERVLGVLAGADLPPELLALWARSATRIYAADGGADRLLALGLKPHVVVGDMDSLDPIWRDAAREDLANVELVLGTDQETSDADKLLALLAGRGYESVTLVGAEGDRLDHLLATLGSAAAVPSLEVSLGLRTGWGRVLRRGVALFDLPEGATVSILPITTCYAVSANGLQWPLSGADLALGGKVSLSNRALGGPVRIEIGMGTALLICGTGPGPHW